MEVIMKQLVCLLFQLALPVFVICAGIPYGNRHHFIESPKLSRWGEWGKLEHCPSDQVVVGMKLKVHSNQGVKDDTGLNAVKFYCQNPYSTSEYSGDLVGITSLVGSYGEWKQDFICPLAAAGNAENKLIAVGFQLRSETSAGVKDDTAGNNLKLVCSDLYQKQGYIYLEGDGTQRGEWTEKQLCWPGYAICGLQTQVETSRSIDTTGLNNMKVRCCKIDSGHNFPTATNTTGSAASHDSGESSSSSETSGESSASAEKDNGNQEDAHDHNHHRGDHAASAEDSAEGAARSVERGESPDEQELVAIVDPEPVEEKEELEANESAVVSNNRTSVEAELHSHPLSESSEGEHHSSSNEEDEHLPEEIAQIEQVDNSEAHVEEDENVSTVTDTQQHEIPAEVVNALEDADSADSPSSQSDHHHPHPFNDKPFHWGTEVTNLTNLNEIAGISEDGSNSLDEEPKSSPRFGQIDVNTTTLDVSNHASQVSHCWHTAGIGSLILLYFAKLVF